MCFARPGSSCRSITDAATSAEIDCRARERVVHRHDRVAVARDPAAVAERPVERLAERDRRVLGRVMRAGLEVARAFDESGRGRRGTRAARGSGRRAPRRWRRARGSAPSSPSRTRSWVSAVARTWRTRRPCGARLAGERREQQVVVLAVAHGDAHAVLVDAHDAAAGEQAVGELVRLARRGRRGSCRTTEAARSRAFAARRRDARAPRASARRPAATRAQRARAQRRATTRARAPAAR